MILEHEIIEQIEEEELGRPLAWVYDLVVHLGRADPFEVLRGMWRDGYIGFVRRDGSTPPGWKCEQVLRSKDRTADLNVIGTHRGSKWVHGG